MIIGELHDKYNGRQSAHELYSLYLNRLKLNYSWKSSIAQLGNQQGARKLYTFGLKRLKTKLGIEEL